MLGAEAHRHALVGLGHRAHRVDVARTGQRLQIEQAQFLPALPRMPAFSNSSRHWLWREVSPERATAISASTGCSASSSASTVAKGTRFHREGAGDAQLVAAHLGLVVKNFLFGMRAMLSSIFCCIACRARGRHQRLLRAEAGQSSGKSKGTSPLQQGIHRRLVARRQGKGLAGGSREIDFFTLCARPRSPRRKSPGPSASHSILSGPIRRPGCRLSDLIDLGIVGDGLQRDMRHRF